MLFILLNAKKSFRIWPKYNQKHETGKRQRQLQQHSKRADPWDHADPKAPCGSPPAGAWEWTLKMPEFKNLTEKLQHHTEHAHFSQEGRRWQVSLKRLSHHWFAVDSSYLPGVHEVNLLLLWLLTKCKMNSFAVISLSSIYPTTRRLIKRPGLERGVGRKQNQTSKPLNTKPNTQGKIF